MFRKLSRKKVFLVSYRCKWLQARSTKPKGFDPWQAKVGHLHVGSSPLTKTSPSDRMVTVTYWDKCFIISLSMPGLRACQGHSVHIAKVHVNVITYTAMCPSHNFILRCLIWIYIYFTQFFFMTQGCVMTLTQWYLLGQGHSAHAAIFHYCTCTYMRNNWQGLLSNSFVLFSN